MTLAFSMSCRYSLSMGSRPPVAILFKPTPDLAAQIQAPMSALGVPLALCNSINDLAACLRLYAGHDPVLCMPLVLEGDRSGINETMQIRSSERYRDFKILAFLTLNDKISLHSFYSAGADVVMPLPLDIDFVTLQLHALAKNYSENQEIIAKARQDKEMTRSTMRFLDTTRDGVAIVDSTGQLIVANRAAERILALDSENHIESFKKIVPQLLPFLEQHSQREAEDRSCGDILSSADITVRKGDGRSAPLLLRMISLIGGDNSRVGFAIGIGDLSIPRQLAVKLSNQEKLRSIALTLAAGALHLMNIPSLGIPGSPLRTLEQEIVNESGRVLLSHVLTPLMELVDIILPPESEIRVSFKDDCEIMANKSDVFQLIGALLFFAVERTGASGETHVETKISDDRQNVAIIFAYMANEIVEPITGDYFMALVQGDHGRFLVKDDNAVYTLKFAQQFAARIGATIEAKERSRWEGKIRIMLPCVAV